MPLGETADIGQGWTLKIIAYNPNANAIVAAASASLPFPNLDPPEGTVFIMFTVEMKYSGDGDHAESPPYLLLQSVAMSQTTYDGFFQSYAIPPEPVFNNVGEVPIGGTASGNLLQYMDSVDAVGLIAFTTDVLTGQTVYFATG